MSERLAYPLATVRAALYARVSHVEAAAGRSVQSENRLPALRRYAEGRGWTIAGEFSDVAAAAVGVRRLGLTRLIEAIQAGNVDVVLATDTASLFRDSRQLVNLESAWLLQYGVVVVTMNEVLDATTAAGKWLYTQVLAFLRSFDAARQSERIKAGLVLGKRAKPLVVTAVVNPMEVLDTYHAGMNQREALAAIRRAGGKVSCGSYKRTLADLRSAGRVDEETRSAALAARGGPRKGGRPRTRKGARGGQR